MNDESFLKELLESFIASEQEKREAITTNYDSRNWNDYSTYVHSLKSSARTIGADKLSKMAQTQENASKEQNIPLIEDGYSPMLQEYSRVTEELKEILSSAGTSSSDEGDDPDILEFFPES